MKKDLLQLAADLSRRGERFVVATVVRRESYSSAHVGDMAIIRADGSYQGWLGGSCTRPTVEREAALALADGQPRLLSLSPSPDPHPLPGITALPLTCHSGGTVDIYIEPVLAAPRLVIFGVSPVAHSLAQLGKAMGYSVDLADPDARASDLPHADRVFTVLDDAELRAGSAPAYAVVASMGQNDEDALAAALAAGPAYVGVVASPKRFAVMRQILVDRGTPESALDRVKNPAGINLGGRTAEEVALSILAEIVQLRRVQPAAKEIPAPMGAEQIDPVCNMRVVVAGARHTGEWNGRVWYFCNARCKQKFLADPHLFVDAAAP